MQNIRHTLFKKYKIVGKNNCIIIKDGKKDVVLTKYKRISGLDIEINGSNNTIILTPETLFKSSKIIIEANNANLSFGTSPEINNLSVFVRLGRNQKLKWVKNSRSYHNAMLYRIGQIKITSRTVDNCVNI